MRKLSQKRSIVLLCVIWMMLLPQFSFSIACFQKECKALLQFKRSFRDRFRLLASWNGTNCCSWNGVGCNQTTGHVTKIDLRNNEDLFFNNFKALFSNFVDSSLLEFKYLNYLDLSGNHFNYTQIPNFLGSMVHLRYLNLSRAFFSGKVPPHLGNLTKLEALDLSFSWPEPSDDVEWISQLLSLRYLWLKNIDFWKVSNLMRLLSSLPLLTSLRLRYCFLQNNHFSLVSLNYTSFMSRVQLLDLSQNLLGDPTPKSFQNTTSLKLLDLSLNKFTSIEGGLSSFVRSNCGLKKIYLMSNYDLGGDVFRSYENESIGCNNLQVLNLRYTSMKTKIPIDWLEKCQNLKSIDLQNSQIYGPIPASVGNLSSLEYVDLSSNDLTGAIPTSFGRLLSLKKLYLQHNILEEMGNQCFNPLWNLEVLDISKNLLKGVLTEAHFANLSQLHTLKLEYNELMTLDMKSNWIPPFQLEFFYATSCVICGSEFPRWLQTQKALFELSLSNTSISSSLPTWFTPQNLSVLDLSFNTLVGPVFTNISDQMPNLKSLFLNDNFLNDSLPPSLCKLKHLSILDLSNNRLSGMIHGCMLTSELILLDLSSNNFSRVFPYSQGNLSLMDELFLRNNHFEGSIPTVLKDLKFLKILDLGGNKFSGNIPTWIGDNLRSLQILILRSNLFNGTIPSSLHKLTYLQILDLAHNQLDGIIPPKLSNSHVMLTGKSPKGLFHFCWHSSCPKTEKDVVQFIKSSHFNYSGPNLWLMVNIDLSNNSLVGFIPNEITILIGLIGLNLSHNKLIGTIPFEIGEMKSLQSLDLSFNQLSGPIPRSLSKLNSLGMLKLSHNKFSGSIPREGHLSTFNEASSFDENPYLCGDPLPKKCVTKNPFEPSVKNIDEWNQEEDKWEKWLLYIMIILGYIVGFWVVVGSLILNKNWRYAYFKFVDEANYKVDATIWRCTKILTQICTRK